MSARPDDPTDLVRLWLSWKRAHEALRSGVIRDVSEHSDLPEAELTVLIHLRGAGGTLRQNALTAATGWDRGRLSHLLTRMESQGLAQRSRLRNGVQISIQPAGTQALDRADGALRLALQQHLAAPLTGEQLRHLRAVLDSLLNS